MKLIIKVHNNRGILESVHSTDLFNSKWDFMIDWEKAISFHKTHALQGQENEFPFYMRKFKIDSQIQVYEISDWFENSKIEKV